MLRRLFTSRSREPSGCRVPEGTVVYAIGDIHGRADLLATLHERILDDASARPEPRRVLVYLGDYVDRGLDSKAVIDMLIATAGDGLEHVHIKGNHEDAMLEFLDNSAIGTSWLGFGGDATLYSYGVDVFGTPPADVERLDHIQAQLRERLPADHLAFLRSLVLSHTEGDFTCPCRRPARRAARRPAGRGPDVDPRRRSSSRAGFRQGRRARPLDPRASRRCGANRIGIEPAPSPAS